MISTSIGTLITVVISRSADLDEDREHREHRAVRN